MSDSSFSLRVPGRRSPGRVAGVMLQAARKAGVEALLFSVFGMAAGLGLAGIATAFARSWWVFDLATHFRLHYVAVALLGLALALLLRRRALALAIVVLAAPHAIALASLVPIGPAQATASVPATLLRVTTVNAFWANWDAAALVDYIEDTDPDVLVVQEAAAQWRPGLLRIGARFPYAVPENWRDASDVVLFSRYPVIESGRWLANARGLDYQTADLDIAGRTVTVVGLHTPSPGSAGPSERRNRYFAEIARYADLTERPMIVAGDFNSTAWSPHFADLIAASGLHDTAEGHGWQPTWPSWLPAAGIQIDHILTSEDFEVRSLARGPEVGSDHFPLTADLAFR